MDASSFIRGLLDDQSDPQLPQSVPQNDFGPRAYGLLNALMPDPYEAAGEAVQQFRAGNPLDAFLTMYGAMPATGALKAAPKAAGIIAYHGSPHSFDRFDMSKIGTGEGAQAYGHGLYFADSEGVAKSYRDALSGGLVNYRGEVPKKGTLEDAIAAYTAKHGSSEHGISALRSELAKYPQFKNEVARLDAGEFSPSDFSASPGSMYQVRINADPEHFLDWDKPLTEQSPVVQQALGQFPLTSELKDGMSLMPGAKLRIENDPDFGPRYFMETDSGMKARLLPKDLPNMVATKPEEVWGRNIVSTVASTAGSEAKASQALREAGIPGIKYLDQGSRSAGDGSRNYVVFDDKLIEILKKYGLIGLLGGGAAMGASQSPNAQQGAPLL